MVDCINLTASTVWVYKSEDDQIIPDLDDLERALKQELDAQPIPDLSDMELEDKQDTENYEFVALESHSAPNGHDTLGLKHKSRVPFIFTMPFSFRVSLKIF